MHTILLTKRWTPATDWTVDCSLLSSPSGRRRWEVRGICLLDGTVESYSRVTFKTRREAMTRVRKLCRYLSCRS
jgi:hypothetical protein